MSSSCAPSTVDRGGSRADAAPVARRRTASSKLCTLATLAAHASSGRAMLTTQPPMSFGYSSPPLDRGPEGAGTSAWSGCLFACDLRVSHGLAGAVVRQRMHTEQNISRGPFWSCATPAATPRSAIQSDGNGGAAGSAASFSVARGVLREPSRREDDIVRRGKC